MDRIPEKRIEPMCGRYTLRATPAKFAEIFDLLRVSERVPRYNIAPTQRVAVVRTSPDEERRELVEMRWGLIPSWAKDAKMGATLINARSETVAAKPSFRSAAKQRRCLIPADGFYEWKAVEGSKSKQPYLIGLADGELFAFAGLWEQWKDPQAGADSAPIETCTILTTEANELLKPLHDRMPVILDRHDYQQWLDPRIQKFDPLVPLMRSYPSEKMRFFPVSTRVNSPRNDLPECAQAIAADRQ
jgi:putative SOS response-associated peptidase YedK